MALHVSLVSVHVEIICAFSFNGSEIKVWFRNRYLPMAMISHLDNSTKTNHLWLSMRYIKTIFYEFEVSLILIFLLIF